MDTINSPIEAGGITNSAHPHASWPRVGVVVLNWNGREVLRECLRSLGGSSYPALDIVVVDNGSSDGSGEFVAAEFPTVDLMRNAVNAGFCAGNNQGVRKLLQRKCDYFLILNNDTVVNPQCIERLVTRAESAKDIAAVSPKILFWRPGDRIWFAGGTFNFWTGRNGHVGYRKLDRARWNRPKTIDFICACAMLVSRRAWQEIGGFDELFFRSAEDLDWSLRSRRAGYRLLYEPEAVVWHRESFDILHNDGPARQTYFYTRNQLAVMWKHAKARHWLAFLPYFGLRCLQRMVWAKGDSQMLRQIPRAWKDFLALVPRLQRWPRHAHPVSNIGAPCEQWQRAWRERNLPREVELCRHRELRQHLSHELAALPDPVIVEAGCGNGAWVAHLQQSQHRVLGVDNYVPALQELKRHFPQAIAVAADVRRMPFPDNFADACISLGVVEHFPAGPQQVLSEMQRILRPGGLLFLTVPYYNWLRRLFIHPLRAGYMALQKRVRRRHLRFVEYRFTRHGITRAVAEEGLQVLAVSTDEYDAREANLGLGLYVDLPAFRGNYPGELNRLGRLVRTIGNAINPWWVSGGILVVAQKRTADTNAEPAHQLLSASLVE
jgi:GT2 family glycosyltransferase/SAM-dependent methyltransferase